MNDPEQLEEIGLNLDSFKTALKDGNIVLKNSIEHGFTRFNQNNSEMKDTLHDVRTEIKGSKNKRRIYKAVGLLCSIIVVFVCADITLDKLSGDLSNNIKDMVNIIYEESKNHDKTTSSLITTDSTSTIETSTSNQVTDSTSSSKTSTGSYTSSSTTTASNSYSSFSTRSHSSTVILTTELPTTGN